MICFMQSIGKSSTTNEEYAIVIKKRIKVFGWLIVAGVLTAALAICNEMFTIFAENSWLSGVYSGVGCGIIAVGIIRISRYKKVLKNETLLREERLKSSDERNIMIASKAMQAATLVLLIASYIIMLIGGFYNRIIFFCFWLIIMIFALSYLLFTKYYNGKL